MAASKMPMKISFILISIAVFCAIFYRAYIVDVRHNEQKLEQQKIYELAEQKKDHGEISALFELYLDNFKSDLKIKAKEYKNNRMLLKKIFSPYNFETAEYTKENYDLFKTHVAPDLRGKAGEIINIFDDYQKKIAHDLGSKNSEISQLFLSQWQEMSRDQLSNYIDFFTKEEQLIQAYEELIEFYYVHSNLFKVDMEKNEFIFEREQDKETEAILREQISVLRK